MNVKLILIIAFFIIIISIQFTLNLILKEIRDIKRIIIREKDSELDKKLREVDGLHNISKMK